MTIGIRASWRLINHATRVERAIAKAERRVLSRQGAFIRGLMIKSLRRRKRSSEAGETPSVHAPNSRYSLKRILFSVQDNSVIVGPTKIRPKESAVEPTTQTVPELLEQGGMIRITEHARRSVRDQWRIAVSRDITPDQIERIRFSHIQPRPFANPALVKSIPIVKEFWKDSI